MPHQTDSGAAIAFLVGVFGPSTEHPIFVCSLANRRDDPAQVGERFVVSREPADFIAFVERWGREGRGTFFCVATLRPDAKPTSGKGSLRHKGSVSEIALFHADVDAKSIAIGLDEALQIVKGLPCPPSVVVRSGHGLHCYWILKEALAPDDIDRCEAINALLGDLVGGDPVRDVCRLMRLPGSRNTKDGDDIAVTVEVADYDHRYEADDIEDMLDMLSPRIQRRQAERKAGGPSVVATNPFLEVAKRFGIKPPIDVERRLREMSYGGAGEAAIHNTQVSVTASLLVQGHPVDEAVDIVLVATQAAAGDLGTRWRWDREERAIRNMCLSWIAKHPQVAVEAAEDVAEVVNLDGRRAKAKPKREPRHSSEAIPVAVAEGVVQSVRDAGHDILLSEGDVWIYGAGVWSVVSPGDEQWIRTLIQEGCDALGRPGDTKSANAAWKRLVETPALYRRHVAWDSGDMIALAGCMINLRTRETSPHSAEYMCRKKVGFDFEAGAACPKWTGFVDRCFRDRAAEGPVLAALLQEWFGSALATGVLAREQRKALFLFGGTRTGKTQIATVARRMIGDPIASPSISEVSKDFGRQNLYGARAWIRDDAINENDALDPAMFKTIVTGEPVEINRKNAVPVTHSFDIPILLTTNAMPRARDASDAIYNRSLVVDMRNEVGEAEAEAERKRLGFDEVTSLGEAIAAEEGAGILQWALDGLDRLRARGRFDIPDSVKSAVLRFKEGNNPTAEFVRVALRASPHSKLERSDLLCAYHAWSREEFGDEAKATGYRVLKGRLEGLPWGLDFAVKTGGVRFVGGLKLSEEGLTLWDIGRAGDGLRNGSRGSSGLKSEVNKQWIRRDGDDDGPGDTHF